MPARFKIQTGLLWPGIAVALCAAPSAALAFPSNPRIELVSPLGARLDARIDAGPVDRLTSDGECFAWVPDSTDPPGIELTLTVIEVRGRRTIKLESRDPVTMPRVRVALSVGCVPATRITQTFEFNLKPVAATPSPGPQVRTTADTKRFADPGMAMVTRPGDSLAVFARLIYPMDAARQTQFIAALRNHNPDLASLAPDEPITSGMRIVFPDLRDLSGIAPQQSLSPSEVRPLVPAAPRAAASPTPAAQKPPRATSQQSATPPAPPAARPAVSNAEKPVAVVPQPKSASTPQALRLSSPEIDLARSANVSQEQRAAIRQRRLLLDADDHMAAILSLQNAVRQLETRLQAMSAETSGKSNAVNPQPSERESIQLKPAKQVEPMAAKSLPVSAPSAVETAPPAARTAIVETASPAPVPPAPAMPAASPPSRPPTDASGGAWWTDPVWLGAAVAILLVLLAGWHWTRRGAAPSPAKPPAPQVPHQARLRDASDAKIERATSDVAPAGPETVAPPMEETIRMAAHPLPADERAGSLAGDESTARFDLDPTPAASLDLALDDRPDEDRVRRLQYMYERFPELMSRTVSIDDADSVINAARLYYEEGQADRACELLTFGVEERPQEVRFWLAQFEIFRLENRAEDFSSLAAKFHVLFSYAPSWPKVRHVGHELDPANPLFAAGRDVLAGDANFDPVVENWLNAPMDFTADALLSDLRRDMFDQFNVDRSDFDTLPTRMGAHR